MKKIILTLVFSQIYLIFSMVLNLKKEAFVDNNIVNLYDVIDNKINIPNFTVRNNVKLPIIIFSDEILKLLLDYNYLNITIIGDKCIVKENINKKNADLSEINVYVSKKRLEKNSSIDPNDFIIRKIKILNDKNIKNFVLDIYETANFVTKTIINPGSVLHWQNLEKKKIVLKGTTVIFFYENPLFSIKQEALSLTDGYLDEKIKIKLKNGKIVNATLKKIDGVLYAKYE